MKNWLRDDLFRKVFRNALTLGSGKFLGSLALWGALLCETHGLSTHNFGVLILITAYVATVRAIARFQSWQLVLHYAAVPWQEGQKSRVVDTIRFAYGLDYTIGLVGMFFAMLGVLLFGATLGIDGQEKALVLLACTVLPLTCGTTDIGILRLLDRVGLLARKEIVSACIKLALTAFAWASGAGVAGFVLAWYVTTLLSQSYAFLLGWQALRQAGIGHAIRPGLVGVARRAPVGTWGFILTSSLNVLMFSSWKPVSNLIVGGTLGSSAAGLYQLASKIISALGSPAGLLEKNCYPEVVRLDPRTRRPWVFTFRFCLLSGLIGLGGMVLIYGGGREVIGLFGAQYVPSTVLLYWMAPALFFDTLTRPLDGILFTSGCERRLMSVEALGSLIYLGLLLAVTMVWGNVEGVGFAYTIARAVLCFLMVGLCVHVYRHRSMLIPPHERR